jgi:LacI family transcriptional regulator/LacI family asc operon transcriptional repressor
MNIYDISKKAGVSIATVSRVLNGNSYVSEKTKEKVLKVIEECSYTPNAFARGLGLNTMSTVGIMCADSSDPYIARAIYFIEQELRQNNYDALLCCTGFDVEVKEKYMNLLLSKRTDAIILVGSNFVEANNEKNQYIREAAKKVPIMIVNGALDGENIYCTLYDDYQAVFEATKALKNSGCKNILYLYNSKSYSGKKKLSGFKSAMNLDKSVSEENYEYIKFFNGNIKEIIDYLTSLRNNGLEFDGIVTADDNLAIGALKYAKENNIKVPNELSIIGFNNSIVAECSEPELTSIDNKLEAVCYNCISTLMNIFDGMHAPLKTVFSAEIIYRGTTRPNS